MDSTNEAEHQELQGQLREKEELLKESERERNALNERLTALEVERQLSMIKYQEEMETSVMAVTTQVTKENILFVYLLLLLLFLLLSITI